MAIPTMQSSSKRSLFVERDEDSSALNVNSFALPGGNNDSMAHEIRENGDLALDSAARCTAAAVTPAGVGRTESKVKSLLLSGRNGNNEIPMSRNVADVDHGMTTTTVAVTPAGPSRREHAASNSPHRGTPPSTTAMEAFRLQPRHPMAVSSIPHGAGNPDAGGRLQPSGLPRGRKRRSYTLQPQAFAAVSESSKQTQSTVPIPMISFAVPATSSMKPEAAGLVSPPPSTKSFKSDRNEAFSNKVACTNSTQKPELLHGGVFESPGGGFMDGATLTFQGLALNSPRPSPAAHGHFSHQDKSSPFSAQVTRTPQQVQGSARFSGYRPSVTRNGTFLLPRGGEAVDASDPSFPLQSEYFGSPDHKSSARVSSPPSVMKHGSAGMLGSTLMSSSTQPRTKTAPLQIVTGTPAASVVHAKTMAVRPAPPLPGQLRHFAETLATAASSESGSNTVTVLSSSLSSSTQFFKSTSKEPSEGQNTPMGMAASTSRGPDEALPQANRSSTMSTPRRNFTGWRSLVHDEENEASELLASPDALQTTPLPKRMALQPRDSRVLEVLSSPNGSVVVASPRIGLLEERRNTHDSSTVSNRRQMPLTSSKTSFIPLPEWNNDDPDESPRTLSKSHSARQNKPSYAMSLLHASNQGMPDPIDRLMAGSGSSSSLHSSHQLQGTRSHSREDDNNVDNFEFESLSGMGSDNDSGFLLAAPRDIEEERQHQVSSSNSNEEDDDENHRPSKTPCIRRDQFHGENVSKNGESNSNSTIADPPPPMMMTTDESEVSDNLPPLPRCGSRLRHSSSTSTVATRDLITPPAMVHGSSPPPLILPSTSN